VADWIVACVALVSIWVVIWQCWEQTRQRRISNTIARMSLREQWASGMREILGYVLDRPELRPYLYDGQACPPDSGLRAQVLTVAEMYGDLLEHGLKVLHEVLPKQELQDWIDFADEMLCGSPAFADLVATHETWWRNLTARHRALVAAGRLPAAPASAFPADTASTAPAPAG
jgi:hypothetical protein